MEVVKILCRCKDCQHSEKIRENYYYCYYWDYESGMSPNTVEAEDFVAIVIQNNNILIMKETFYHN